MLAKAGTLLRVCSQAVKASRDLSVTPIVYKAATSTDPIQQLFVDKIRLYAQKSKEAGGKLVDATPAVEARFQSELHRVEQTYGVGKGEDFTKFPTFSFKDTPLEPVSVQVELKPEEPDSLDDILEEEIHWIEAIGQRTP
ncbi:ATP synthase-coupling factor 6, mitochondrial-like [Watersipora subatra]|uniref:ATP synthase-coupling factor 6, mitochondrial-like n=1 Tax=Watersipora subatra TaxID=2589382 RepID=UPI00355C89C0